MVKLYRKCSAPNCDNKSFRGMPSGKHFFALPLKNQREAWLAFIGGNAAENAQKDVCLCEDHFEDRYFSSTLRSRLNTFARPTIHASIKTEFRSKAYLNKHPCCVPGCKDMTSSRHRFPNSDHFTSLWLEKIKNPKFDGCTLEEVRKKTSARVCIRHFAKEHVFPEFHRKLSCAAVPTLHLPGCEFDVCEWHWNSILYNEHGMIPISHEYEGLQYEPKMPRPYIKCAVVNCKTKLCRNAPPQKRLFHLPAKRQRSAWLDFLGLQEGKHCRNIFMCEDHFEEKWFTSSIKQRLSKFARPTISVADAENAPEAEEDAASFVQKIMEGPEVIIVDDDDDDDGDIKEEVEVKFIIEESSELDDVVDEINNLEKTEDLEKEEFVEHSYCKETAGLCRLCQMNKGKFIIVLEDGLNDNIAKYIKIDLSSPAGLPQVICSCCKTLIDSFHKYVLKVHYVNKQLENAYTKVQTGPPAIESYQHGIEIEDTNVQLDDSINNKDDTNPPMLDCRLCGLSFTINDYFIHVKKNHQILYRCGIKSCQQSFSSKGNLQRHMNRHIYKRESFRLALFNREFECQICKKAFGTKSILIRHRKHHYNFKCPVKDCDRILKSWNTFEAHRRLHGDQRRRLCHVCGKTYSASTTFRAHQQTHSLRHVCKFCNKEYSTRAILLKHIQIKHEGVKYYCSKCPNSYSTRMNLIFHERVHTGKPGYKCSLCPKAFYRNSRLKIHMQTHQEGYPYECRICAKSFKLESSRRSHERIHLGEKFTCNVTGCNKIFTRIDRVKNHLRNKHPNEFKVEYELK